MDDEDVGTLRKAVGKGKVVWTPDSATAMLVLRVAPHAEEGGNEPCAIFDGGRYVALYNAELRDFVAATPLEEGGRLWAEQ